MHVCMCVFVGKTLLEKIFKLQFKFKLRLTTKHSFLLVRMNELLFTQWALSALFWLTKKYCLGLAVFSHVKKGFQAYLYFIYWKYWADYICLEWHCPVYNLECRQFKNTHHMFSQISFPLVFVGFFFFFNFWVLISISWAILI